MTMIKFPGLLHAFLMLYVPLSPALGFILGAGVGDANNIRCLEGERQALLEFKKGLVDDSGKLSSWRSEDEHKDCCNWKGVHCDNQTGHVLELEVHDLRGMISPSILELPSLTTLDLSGNDFNQNHIPEFICSLSNLTYLDLSSANLSGSFPDQLGNLSHLQRLYLYKNKHDVFIADDLQLKDLFKRFSAQSLFVWYPQPSKPSLPQMNLFDIYRKIGVPTISESVGKEESYTVDVAQLNQVNPKENLITKDLVTLILGFLANPVMKMEAERRHEIIRGLLNITFLEIVEPITVKYSLSLSSGEIVNARASRMICWDRESSKFFTQKLDRSSAYKNQIEYATYFSEAISEGVLWGNCDHIGALSELIKLAFVLEFDEEAVRFLMESKNLQIYLEDEQFLASVFPSG